MDDVQLFLLRTWQRDGGFRASVRAAGDDEPRFFSTPEQLAEFLRTVTAAGQDAGAAKLPDTPPDAPPPR